MDAPRHFFGRFGACGQVLSCVRPLIAARHTPRALMEMRGGSISPRSKDLWIWKLVFPIPSEELIYFTCQNRCFPVY